MKWLTRPPGAREAPRAHKNGLARGRDSGRHIKCAHIHFWEGFQAQWISQRLAKILGHVFVPNKKRLGDKAKCFAIDRMVDPKDLASYSSFSRVSDMPRKAMLHLLVRINS
jgi:hypothetical protein